MNKKSDRDQGDQVGDLLAAYNFSTGLLRAWLGTYSVGVPAFIFSREDVLKKLVSQHRATGVAELFALAISLQVAITLINKYIEWGAYAKYSTPKLINWYTNFADKASEWIWLDALADVGTIALLAWGSVVVFSALVA